MKPEKLIDSVRQYADEVLDKCRDRYGCRATPLLIDGLEEGGTKPIRWEAHVLSNPARQQDFARVLEGLSALTGDKTYRSKAEEWLGFALKEMRDPNSDMQIWGGHASYDLESKAPLLGNHELKCVYPHYRLLYQIDPQAVLAFVDGFWHKHIDDWSTLLFNRHGEYEDWDRRQRWAQPYAGGELPIVDNRLLSFINTGSDLVCGAVMASVLGGEEVPLTWALRLLGRYDEIRNPDTKLGGYQFNHRDPCRVRESFKPPFGDREDVNETTVLNSGYIQTRGGRAAITWMNLYEELGSERGRDFLAMVATDLTALADHTYDEADHAFKSCLVDGTRLSPDDAMEGVGYCPPKKLQPLQANGVMFLSYARAFRLTGNNRFREMALSLARGMGWGDLDNGGRPTPEDADGLVGLLDLAAAGEATHLEQAAKGAGRLVRQRRGGLLDASQGEVLIDDPMPLALLHVAAAQLGRPKDVAPYYSHGSPFDPKVIIARRHREEQKHSPQSPPRTQRRAGESG
jgi:pectate lyase